MATTWQPNGNHLATQVSIGKDSLVKDSIKRGEAERRKKKCKDEVFLCFRFGSKMDPQKRVVLD